MSTHASTSRCEVRETVQELRRHRGLFSFRNDVPEAESVSRNSVSPELGVRPGGIVECLVARQGAGAFTAAMQIMAHSSSSCGFWVVVDPAQELYFPALSGWGIDPSRALLVHPQTKRGNVVGDRGMSEMPWCVGHVCLGRRSIPRSRPKALATCSRSRRRSGSVLQARCSETGTCLGRVTIAIHTHGGNSGGHQTTEYRGSISPGRPRRHCPGVGDRPCRGSCASGSRNGPFRDYERKARA